VGITNEDRRKLTIDAAISAGRDQRIAWALHALELGAAPSPNLCSLALLSVERMPNPWQVDELFRGSIQELALPRPSQEECLRQHARDVAEGIVSGAVEPLEGARQLYRLAVELNYSSEMMPWVGFDEDLFVVPASNGETRLYLFLQGGRSDEVIPEIERQAHTLLQKIPKEYF
jgi:hypothetical protein